MSYGERSWRQPFMGSCRGVLLVRLDFCLLNRATMVEATGLAFYNFTILFWLVEV
jgi:hypothetical protein